MPIPELTDEEINVLRQILARVVLQQRTGKIGVLHGTQRFVSIDLLFRKPQRLALESAAHKLGVPSIAIDKG
jgi:hypothetical protein